MRVNLSSLTSGTVIKKGFLAVVPLQDIAAPPAAQTVVTLFTISGTANGASATLQVLKPGQPGAPFVFSSTVGSGASQELDLNSGRYTSIELPYDFTVSSVTTNSSFNYSFELVTSRLADIFSQAIKKIEKINKKLDYAIRIASENVSITNSYTVGVSGITVNSCTTNMSGNDLFVYASLSLNTTAQNSIGTGSLTPKLILTVTCSDLYKDTINSDNDINFVKISGADITVVFPSGEGASPVASFHAVPSISGSNLVIKIYVKNVKAKGSAWYIRARIPVLRMQPYVD